MSETPQRLIVIEFVITLEEIRRERPPMVFYGAMSCWWTHNPEHLEVFPDEKMEEVRRAIGSIDPTLPGLPCDPRCGLLMQGDNVEKFISIAEANPERYGRHGLKTFLASHHQNCHLDDGTPWCMSSWEEYNVILDQQSGDVD